MRESLDLLIWRRFNSLKKPNKRIARLSNRYRNLKKYRKKNAENPTPQEKTLEMLLRKAFKHENIQSQMIFREGKGGYIVDLYIPSYHLAFEADGFQHIENKEYDDQRDKTLNGLGVLVFRIANYAFKYKPEEVLKSLEEVAKATKIKDYAERRRILLNLQQTIKNAFGWRSGQSQMKESSERKAFVTPSDSNKTQGTPEQKADLG